MKTFLILLFTFNLLLSSNTKIPIKNTKSISEKQIEIEMEREKKYAREQTFYQSDSYDFKGSEVNEESLKNIKDIEVDDLDMDSVYD